MKNKQLSLKRGCPQDTRTPIWLKGSMYELLS